MEATKALVTYMRLRARREQLARNPPDTAHVTYERFTPAEAERLRVAEVTLNRLSGAAALELFIAHRSSVLDCLK